MVVVVMMMIMTMTMMTVCYTRGCIQKFPDRVIRKYTLITINARWKATQRIMVAKLTRLTHKIVIQLYPVQRVLPFAVLASGGHSGNFWIRPRKSCSFLGFWILSYLSMTFNSRKFVGRDVYIVGKYASSVLVGIPCYIVHTEVE